MAPCIEFKILGPLGMYVDGRAVQIPRGRQRVLLATLLSRANSIVPTEELIECVWNGEQPYDPRGALHTCVTRLRKTISHRGGERSCGEMIKTYTAGYAIEIASDRLDLLEFRDLVAAAWQAEERGDLVAQSKALMRAVALWRGPMLTDVPSEVLHRDVVPESVERYLASLEQLYGVGLALGRHREVVGPLRALVGKHPFRERFCELLMLALYRSGRQIEALQTYRDVSTRMREELGVSPGPALRDLQLAVLRQDPGLVEGVPGSSALSPLMPDDRIRGRRPARPVPRHRG